MYGTVSLTYLNSYYGTWAVYDNLFDTVSITATVLDPYNNPLPNDYNGYISTTQLSSSPNNKTVNTRDYASGPLGTNYYPQTGNNLNQLNGAGSRTAALAGLYRYTVRVDQNEEAGATHAAIGCHYVALNGYGLAKDYDSDGLPDYFEDRNGNGSYDMAQGETKVDNPDTNGDGLSDLKNWQLATPTPICDVQVNDPAQDAGNEQNTQSETAVIAFGNTVIAAFVDSNLGVVGYGTDNINCGAGCPSPTNLVRFTGWAVSTDGGMTFSDKGAPPTDGNILDTHYIFGSSAGDPVLARDETANIVYLLANPKRPSTYTTDGTHYCHHAPLWRSLDNGQHFQTPINATLGLTESDPNNYLDKPAIAVDNYSGTSQGQGNLYLAYELGNASKIVFYRSGPGGTTLVNTAQLGVSAFGAQIVVAPSQTQNHPVHVVWREISGSNVYFKASKSTDQGMTFPSVVPVLTANGGPNTPNDLRLRRSDSSSADDYFRTPIIPVLAVNQINGNLYLVYTDKSTTSGDNADIFFVQSTDGGDNWSAPYRVNSDNPTTSKDQWQPAITVKPDGTRLFIAWYDRRDDTANNSLIHTYGVFVDLPISGATSFSSKANFPISSVCFPPAFTGRNRDDGTYDPIYPPNFNDDLNQCYFSDLTKCCQMFCGYYAAHMGDYDVAFSDNTYIYYTWGDNRITCTFHGKTRNQADVRFTKIAWP